MFGASVLETLTTGMYTNPLDSVRELVQNSFDSVRSASKAGLMSDEKVPLIEITIDLDTRSLTVRDNGKGVASAEAEERLTYVGTSNKVIGEDVGFRGIGRLHSIAYCDRLVFTTKAQGESIVTKVSLNAAGLREWMRPGKPSVDSASDILYTCSDICRKNCTSVDEHFFEVRLEGVLNSVPELLDFDRLHDYLCLAAPVDFATQFLFANRIRKFASSKFYQLDTVPLLLRSGSKERYIYKPYKGTYKPLRDMKDNSKESGKIEVEDIEFWIPPSADDPVFWIWYSKSDLIAQIGNKSIAGFCLRKHNMSVGGVERIEELIQETRFCRYFVGEIHIQDARCIPNARRDGFEDTPEWSRIKEQISQFLKDRERDVRLASKLRANPIAKTIRSSSLVGEKVIADATGGVTSKSERENLHEQVEKAQVKLGDLKRQGIPEDIAEEYQSAEALLEQAKDAVESAEFVVVKTKGILDRKQKKLLQDLLELLQSELTEAEFRRIRGLIMMRFEGGAA